MMHKILHVSHSLETGGGPLYIKKIIDDIPDFQHYVAGNRGYFYDLLKSSLGDDKVVSLSGKNILANLGIIRRLCSREQITVIHCHGRGAGVYSRLVKIFNPRIKVIYTVHGFHPETVRPGVRYFYILLERLLFRLTDYVIHVSQSEKARFLQHVKPFDPSRCLFIPNYISEDNIVVRPLPVMPDPHDVNIVYIGRLGHEKGIDILVDAMVALRGQAVKLWIIGYGPWEDYIASRIQHHALSGQVTMLGKYDGASGFLKHFDAIAIPSRYEGMPFIGLEAMIARVPVIATPAVGITDLVSTETAYMASDFTADALGDSIKQFLVDLKDAPDRVQQKVDDNFKTVKTTYSPDNATKIRALYLKLSSV